MLRTGGAYVAGAPSMVVDTVHDVALNASVRKGVGYPLAGNRPVLERYCQVVPVLFRRGLQPLTEPAQPYRFAGVDFV